MADLDRPLLAQGRDAAIYDLGDGRVLRRALDGRSLAAEAEVMAYAHAGGVPVPAVYDVTADGGIVMDRVRGRTLLEDVLARPEVVDEVMRVIVELHEAVHRLAAPPGLRRTSLPGDRLLHLDLHVQNVIRTADGPVLVDWANAKVGPAEADLAMTWLLHATARTEDLPDGTVEAAEFDRVRRRMLAGLRDRLDVQAVAAVLPEVASWRVADRNVSATAADLVRAASAAFPAAPS